MDDTSYSTGGLQDRSLQAALETIAAAGFPQAEVSCQEPHFVGPPTGHALAEFRAMVGRTGVKVRTVHAPAREAVLGTTNEEWRSEVLGILESYIQFAGAISATAIVIHPVPNPMFVPDPDDPAVPQLIADGVRRSLDRLVPVAAAAGVRITLENLPYRIEYPLLTMGELRPLVDDYPDDRVGLIIDTGHVGVLRMEPAAEIHAAGDRLWGTHIHDVDFSILDGDHRAPNRGGFEWPPILEAFHEIGYPGPWTFESSVATGSDTKDDVVRITREAAVEWGLT